MSKIKNIISNKGKLNINHRQILNPLNLLEINNLYKSLENTSFIYDVKKEIISDWYFDYLVGIYSKYTIEVEIYLNDIYICKQSVIENCYTAFKCNVIPLHFILQNHGQINVKLKICDDLIFNKMSTNDIRCLVFCSCIEVLEKNNINGFKTLFFCCIENTLTQVLYEKNKISVKKDDDIISNFELLEIPIMIELDENYKKFLSKKVCDFIRYELMSVTMNPDRINYFLSNYEKKKYNIKLD